MLGYVIESCNIRYTYLNTNTVKSQFVAALELQPQLKRAYLQQQPPSNSSRSYSILAQKRGKMVKKQSIFGTFSSNFWNFCNCSRPLIVAALKQRPHQLVAKKISSCGYKLRSYGNLSANPNLTKNATANEPLKMQSKRERLLGKVSAILMQRNALPMQ